MGGWLTQRLLERGAAVTAWFATGFRKRICRTRGWPSASTSFAAAERVAYLLERVLGEYEIEVVFHLAAQTIVGIANRNPISTFESNIRGTWNLLEACRRSPS